MGLSSSARAGGNSHRIPTPGHRLERCRKNRRRLSRQIRKPRRLLRMIHHRMPIGFSRSVRSTRIASKPSENRFFEQHFSRFPDRNVPLEKSRSSSKLLLNLPCKLHKCQKVQNKNDLVQISLRLRFMAKHPTSPSAALEVARKIKIVPLRDFGRCDRHAYHIFNMRVILFRRCRLTITERCGGLWVAFAI